ncbi:MAG TPA: hypothetical protein GXZ35_07920 [Acholeplasmataceae bacterium]|nr:hypothetical protein [Acholeplasmataceae bacterium]
MNLNNTYFGFTDNMKPMQKAKVEKILDKKKRFDGVILTNKEFIYRELKSGLITEVKENYQYYKRDGELTKPKTEYRLKSPDNSYWTIEKTLFNYANYISENGFLDEQRAKEFIITEQNRLRRAEQERINQEQKEKEVIEKAKQEKIEFDQWLTAAAQNYSDTEKLQILKDIFTKEFGNFSGNSIKLLVLIDNFDNPQCKAEIREWLAYFNTASLKTFYAITGINLGKTDKAIQARLNEITSNDFMKRSVQHK